MATSKGSLRLLVVDDDTPLREMLARSFSREGHSVTAVADGSSALEAAERDTFDVVLLDVALGQGPAGHEVCRE
ncbi:MAG TPA: response regulator, partial [Solirubrobacteraceae bacterium]|nr:response regulator [Solirubrobacteraceae bacterium]